MKEYHLFYAPDLAATGLLPPDEAAHAVRVLRMKEGDTLRATDGRGTFFTCRLALASPHRCAVEIVDSHTAQPAWQGTIHLAVAPTKHMERMEWLAEKATEIGLDSLTFVDCRNSERHVVKPERIERIVIAATKQSHKAWKPIVAPMTPFAQLVSRPFSGQRFIAHCHNMAPAFPDEADPPAAAPSPFLGDVVHPDTDALVLIGPEGDFSPEEVALAIARGFVPISLGPSRLRTETAALAAVHILSIAKRH